MEKSEKTEKLMALLLYVCLTVLLVGCISVKQNFHVDEVLSYGLSNNHTEIGLTWLRGIFEEGAPVQWYKTGVDPMMEWVAVQSGKGFDYAQVWTNQIGDVHPPVYYVFLHTICSLMPGVFSTWQAGIINVVFSILALFVYRKLLGKLGVEGRQSWFCSWMFVLCTGVLTTATFFRMYTMTIFEVLLISYFMLEILQEKENGWKPFLWFGLSLILGALTHYYVIVYAVLLCVVAVIYMAFKREWKKIGYLCLSSGIAGLLSYLAFPAMIEHMFFGYRGAENVTNLAGGDDFRERLDLFYLFFNSNAFNGTLKLLVLGGAACVFLRLVTKRFPKLQFKDGNLPCLFIFAAAIVLDFFLVCKIASYVTDRYLAPIIGITVLVCSIFLARLLHDNVSKKWFWVLSVLFLVFYFALGVHRQYWLYLYSEEKPYLEELKTYSGTQGIRIYKETIGVPVNFAELEMLDEYATVSYKDLDALKDLGHDSSKPLVIIVDTELDTDSILKDVAERYDLSEEYLKLGSHDRTTTFVLLPKEAS